MLWYWIISIKGIKFDVRFTGKTWRLIKIGHEYKANKNLRNYTAGAVALPVGMTTAVLGGPAILAGANAAGRVAASGAGAVTSMADSN